MNCHAGCDTEDILKDLGLNWEVMFPNDKKGSGTSKQKRSIVKVYPYTDEQNNVLFEAVRFEPKDFRQRQPDPNGGHIYNLKGVRRVIYNLPAVLEGIKEGTPIFVVEGEKDAEALIKRGLIATTSPMGAGKWNKGLTEFFTGADAIILPDNDKPGREHAVMVASKIIDVAKQIRILELPGLKLKEDVSDWLMEGSKDELLELAFNTDPVKSVDGANSLLGNDSESERDKLVEHFFEENNKIYSTENDQRLVSDFAIDINSVVNDDELGQILYIHIREYDRGKVVKTNLIEVPPTVLDDVRAFYKIIRPYTMGEIIQERRDVVKPIKIFKWLLNKFEKPHVRRPDHVGFIDKTESDKRPYWLFGNALVCPPYRDKEGEIIYPNDSNEFIVDEHTGFTLPIYKNDREKEQLVPMVKVDTDNAAQFLGEVKTKLIDLIGGGDKEGNAKNYGKILLAYVVYHLYEQELFRANDVNGHTVMLYVFGQKGTGKTTYFNTILRAFFGLHKTKELKGTSVSVPALENQMGMYSQLPVCYDEYNPDSNSTAINYQHINGYYHKTSRSVSDTERAGRNKYTPVRSTFSITSNYRINLDVDQADATESRVIYFDYKKEYRSSDYSLFEWFEQHLDDLSKVTTHLLLHQTPEKRNSLKNNVRTLFSDFKDELDALIAQNPKQYIAEHRLTDNYIRLLGCYELVFGEDQEFRSWIKKELLSRFAHAKANQKEHALINQLIYLASAGRIKESWQYNYNDNQKELYISLSQLYEAYSEYRRDKSLSNNQFKEVMKDFFEECGGYTVGTKKWCGTYYDRNHDPITVNKSIHSYILDYSQVHTVELLEQLFPPKGEQKTIIESTDKIELGDNEDDLPF
jgi:hypothetical protein